MNEKYISLAEVIGTIKKRWKLITSIVIVLTLVVAGTSFFLIKPQYEASTKLFIGKDESSKDSKNSTYNASDVQMYQQLLKTYTDVIETNDLITRAIKDKNINVSADDILKKLSVTPGANTQILEISYTSNDKNQAKDVIAAITDEFIKTSTQLISNANVKVVETVRLPQKPVSPNKKLNIVIALFFGFMIGVGLAFFIELTDTTLRSKEDLEEILGIPVIGEIPNIDKDE